MSPFTQWKNAVRLPLWQRGIEGDFRIAASVLLLTLACLPPAAQAAELGRLFFTPQERAELEARGGAQNDERGPRDSITVNGMIQKNGGKRIVWIDGKPQAQPVSPGKSPTSVQVVLPGSVTAVEVKVGQRIELNSVAAPENRKSAVPAPDDDD